MIDLPVDQDAVRKYLCDDAPDARLMTVKLGQSTDDMLDHQQMPAPIKALCAELVAATCVLAHMLKFDGEMIVQIKRCWSCDHDGCRVFFGGADSGDCSMGRH